MLFKRGLSFFIEESPKHKEETMESTMEKVISEQMNALSMFLVFTVLAFDVAVFVFGMFHTG